MWISEQVQYQNARVKSDLSRYNACRIDNSSKEYLTQIMSDCTLWCPDYVGGKFKQEE